MDKQSNDWFQIGVARLVGAISSLSLVLAFFLVVPLSLWLAWAHHTTIANSLLVCFFSISFGWGVVSVLLLLRKLRTLGLSAQERMRLFSGSRPSDQDELRAWHLGWHFIYAVLAVALCMIAIPIESWLSGK